MPVCSAWIASLAYGGSRSRDPVELLSRGPGVTNHPVGVIPSNAITVPADWPLDPDGSITCLTCHTRLPSFTGDSPPHLRGGDKYASPVEFCATCHAAQSVRSASGAHWMAVQAAHLQPEHLESAGSASLLDHGSMRCMECHDGVNAKESDNTIAWNRGPGTMGDERRSHPVGVPYGRLDRGRSVTRLRPAGLLPKEVHLPGGQVSCISCHDLYAPGRHKLAVTTDNSALCFACHDMG